VADTRLLLTLEFPPNERVKVGVEKLVDRELSTRLLAPSVVLSEFIKIGGRRIGEEAVLVRINLLKQRGMRVVPIDEEMAIMAGKTLLAKPDVPFADALIASLVKLGRAEYIVSDDPHYEKIGVASNWI
jgi:predicted nucleic acid-binding protein